MSSLRNYCCHKPEVLICVTLKIEFNTQAYFHIPVNEDESTLINNTGVWSTGYPVPPYYGELTPDQVYCYRTAVKLTDAVHSGVDTMSTNSNTDNSCWYRQDASIEAIQLLQHIKSGVGLCYKLRSSMCPATGLSVTSTFLSES